MEFKVLLIILILSSIFAIVFGNPSGSDGSKCPNTSCSPPLPGAQCEAKYERDDGCCPVWYCTLNGATSQIYGKSTGSSSSSSSFSSSSGNMGGFPMIQLPNLGNLFNFG